ncbi:MAG: hypothetical protein GQ570_10950 [Helicobacteraceae bacterium]|nr:hypothetical protein [Helicobacteraceae bacterium]
MKLIYIVTLFVMGILFSGCSNHVVQDYMPDPTNKLKYKLLKDNNVTMKLALSSDGGKDQHTTFCRLLTKITTHTGEPYHVFIRRNLKDELIKAGIYDDDDSNNIITIYLNHIYASSDMRNAYWQYSVVLQSSNGKSIVVETTHPYPSSFSGGSACRSMQQHFVFGTEKLISDILNHEKFNSLFTETIVEQPTVNKFETPDNKADAKEQYFMLVESKLVNSRENIILFENALVRYFNKYFINIKPIKNISNVSKHGKLIKIDILEAWKFPKRGMKIFYELEDLESKEIISKHLLKRSTLFGGTSKVVKALSSDIGKNIVNRLR